MRSTKAKRWLSGTLAALMLAQGMCLPVGAEAWWNSNWGSWLGGGSSQAATQETKAAAQLQNGTAVIPSDATEAEVKDILFNALVSNKEALGKDFNAQSLNWEYYCEGKDKTTGLAKNSAWGSINGFETQTGNWVKVTYYHPALKDNKDTNYQVRLEGTTDEVALTKAAKLSSSIVLNENCEVALPYNEDTTVNYDALRESIFNTVVKSKTPENLSVRDVTIEYYAENVAFGRPGGTYAWMPLEGGKSDIREFPAISKGSQKIRISWAGNDEYYGFKDQEVQVTITERTEVSISLKSGCTVSTASGDWNKIHQAILDNVVDSSTCPLTVQNTTIEYKSGYTDWSWKTLTLDGIEDNQNYTIRVKYNGSSQYQEATSNEVDVLFASKEYSNIAKNDGSYSANLSYNEDLSVNYDALREAIFDAVVDTANSTPSDLDWEDVTIKYYATATTGSAGSIGKAWMPLEGGKDTLTYPAISEGPQQIRISYAENDQYYGDSIEVNVTITERPTANIQVNENPTVQLTVDENLNLNVNKLYQDMFNAIVQTSDPVLTLDDVTIEYYATATTGAVGELGKAWMPLEGGKDTLTYPAIPAGSQQVRISWPGNQQYAPTTIEATVQVNEREQVKFNQKQGPYEVGMVFNDEQGYDYTATAKAIYDAVVESTTPAVDYDQVKVEYNASLTPSISEEFKPLDGSDWTGLKKFGTGSWEIKISVADTQAYRGNSITVDVTTTDNRAASSVVLKSGASFTYNMDANAMKQAIFDNVIDWNASTLPAKETLSLNNFVIEYYGKVVLFDGGIDSEIEGWAPIEGKSYDLGNLNLGAYPQMGAGENQQLKISFKGDANYRPSQDAQGTVTVNKAKVSVKVNSTNIYADEQLPADFITTDPADKFDIYTIYAGITSNVTTGVYLDLPDRYTNNAFLEIIDGALELAGKKTLTQMMQDGVTVGELQQLFSTQELLDLLDKLNIDTGTFGQILTVINKLPGIMDSVRVGFGTPNRAGLYTVTAVTDNKNYETGVGFGFLLSKMRFSGPKLTWNQEISGGKLTAEQAKTFDFGATLSYNGDVTVSQEGVHYLYSGFTSKWKVYSSTTTPPTEPGRYVVTVCILGGNYMAAPITRSFQITK